MGNKRICIGIPCYGSAPAETLEDYMRFAYHLGRRMTNYDFMLAIKPKFEQFRARNAIFQAAAQMDAEYLMCLDDDHVIGWRECMGPNEQYDFLRKLITHMEDDPKLGLVGALYYHRGSDCLPVVMKQGQDGGYYYMRDDEIVGGLQDVAVTGGGAMLCRMDAMLRLPQPIFEPEFRYGTDIQVCQKMREAGYRVKCDTSLILGHVMNTRQVITPDNRVQVAMQSQAAARNENQFDPKWVSGTAYNLFYLDGMEYLELTDPNELARMADQYNYHLYNEFPGRDGDLETYYRTRGNLQVARQLYFHGTPTGLQNDLAILGLFNSGDRYYGLDWGCGSSPIGFELALRGNKMDFVDLDGAGAYEFLKWRVKKRDLEARCGWEVRGPYDFIMFMDSLEHLPDPCATIAELAPRLKEGGCIITNYFTLTDDENAEHISMDREAVKQALLSAGIYPMNQVVWVKRNLAIVDKDAA